ncbi:MAG: glycosyltransferase [Pirellulales bacterium]|nr:glycosyltransferase [Pirellulales bacterium]
MPRILHVIPTLDRAGAEKQLVLLAGGLVEHGFDVRVAALTRGGPLLDELTGAGVRCEVLGKRWKIDPFALRRLSSLMRRERPALVHTWLFAGNSYGRAAALWNRVPHLVATERCADPWKVWHELAIDRWLARRTDRIVVNSTGVREFYLAQGLPADKLLVIPNGIGPARTSRYTRAALLAQLGLPSEARLILAVGRLWPQKRVKDLIWAADLLKVIRPDVHLLVIGDGPQRELLERFRRQVQIEDRVHLLGERSDVPDLLPHAQALWLASEYEGLPNVVMEAFAAGVPVVATDIPGTRDLVTHDETGLLVPVGDRAGFARQTQFLLTEPELGPRLAAAARRKIESEFSIARMVSAHVALYRELLGEPSA